MKHDAIVLGGGCAGLSAACALAEAGARVLVLEARPALGGRASAFTDPATGERLDNGQHVLFGCYRDTFQFLTRIGAQANVQMQRELAVDVIDPGGRSSRLVCPALPSPLHLLAGVLDWEALPWRDRASILRIRRPLMHARASLGGRQGKAAASPDETVRQWLIRNGQSHGLIELFWEPLALAALNQPIGEAAALPFTHVIAELSGTDPSNAAVGLPRVPLDEMYAEPARTFMESRGGTVRTGASARIVAGALGTEVSVDGERLTAPVVICAVPWFELPVVLADVPALASVVDAASRTAASPIVTVNLWFDEPMFGRPFVSLPGRLMQWAFEFEKENPNGTRTTRLSLVSSGARPVVGWANEHLIDRALGDITAALQRPRRISPLRATVVRERRATFSLAPGQPRRPATLTPVQGLLLAGDWIDTGLPATIEGAVRSGHLAAGIANS